MEPPAPAPIADLSAIEPPETFTALGLSEGSARGAAHAGFVKPTAVQEKVIPQVAAGRDVIAGSETGSGKTAAFVLPILDRLDYSAVTIQALVVVPTRELCQQVAGDFRQLGAGQPLRVAEILGGVGYAGQRRQIAANPQVVVGTPGRVLDLLQSRQLSFRQVRILVLDEADRMLDMGFLPQVRDILRHVPRVRQTLMFSATIPEQISRLAAVSMKDPVNILVGERAKPPEQVTQEAIYLLPSEKEDKLLEVAAKEPGSILIFCGTKAQADVIHRVLHRAGHSVCVIHADRNQQERRQAMEGFASGKYRIMVATDLAQRGLDIQGIALVLNYDVPKNAEDYVHRIGRTARVGASGDATSFVTSRELGRLREVEQLIGAKLPVTVLGGAAEHEAPPHGGRPQGGRPQGAHPGGPGKRRGRRSRRGGRGQGGGSHGGRRGSSGHPHGHGGST